MKIGLIVEGYDGAYKLIDEKTLKPVALGDKRKTFRGESVKLNYGLPPHKRSSSGKVGTTLGEFYASVIGAKWEPCGLRT